MLKYDLRHLGEKIKGCVSCGGHVAKYEKKVSQKTPNKIIHTVQTCYEAPHPPMWPDMQINLLVG